MFLIIYCLSTNYICVLKFLGMGIGKWTKRTTRYARPTYKGNRNGTKRTERYASTNMRWSSNNLGNTPN